MKTGIRTKDMVLTALLIALGIIIPVYFSGLRVTLPPFSATLLSHVPIIIAMFLSPWSAVFTAIGTTLGFIVAAIDPVVTVRAASHIIFAVVGAWMIQKRQNLIVVGLTAAILHAVSEILVVYGSILLGISAAIKGTSVLETVLYVTGLGTFVHHIFDYTIACMVGSALMKAKLIPPLPPIWKKQ